MRPHIAGFTIVELLVALSLIATVSAALLPAIASASQLQRSASLETEAAVIAASRLETVKAAVRAGVTPHGGALDMREDGWHLFADREGQVVPIERASFECRWQAGPLGPRPDLSVVSVRVIPLADARTHTVTFASVVLRE